MIKSAKKYESKGKNKKAKKRYEKALKLLVKANKEKPNQPDILNYLGFATRKLGDYKKGEEYYLLGLQFDPDWVWAKNRTIAYYFYTPSGSTIKYYCA